MASTKTIWQTKDGQRIKVRDMTDQHLVNTVRLLHRYATRRLHEEVSAGYSCLSMLQGEMATYYCEQDISRLETTNPEEFLYETVPTYGALMDELEKRKLSLNATKPHLS